MQKGFTLVELLVVVAVIGVLFSGAIIMLNPSAQFNKAADSKRKADFALIQAGLELYRSDIGSYPSTLSFCTSSSLAVSGVTYIKTIPCDPKNTGYTVYTYLPSGSPVTTYLLIACLENISDPQRDTVNNSAYCSGAYRSYTVTNP